MNLSVWTWKYVYDDGGAGPNLMKFNEVIKLGAGEGGMTNELYLMNFSWCFAEGKWSCKSI